MVVLFFQLAQGPILAESGQSTKTDGEETVILIHGMGRSRASMLVLQQRLKSDGYTVLNFPYETISDSLDKISDDLQAFIGNKVTSGKYHLIAHSLGNIVIRNGFRKGWPKGLGRIVMIAPPNQPSQLAEKFKGNRLYRWRTGDSGQKLADPTFYEDLPVPSVEFGVIAGNRGQKLTFEEPNDGIIAVSSAKLEGMTDWIELKHTHTFIMNAKDTFEACVSFLEHGSFDSEISP